MSLFIRVETGFWTHRKTIRLRAALGESGLWLPQRLWSYAAEHQPDGDFSGYSPDELAMLLGYSGNAQAMLQAFQQCGFMDEMKIHGWEERNSYHAVFSERAKKAAAARWGKKGKRKREDIERSEALLQAFAIELSLTEADGTYCFHKWEGNGWTVGGKPIKSWKATMRAWKAAGYMPSQKAAAGRPAEPAWAESPLPQTTVADLVKAKFSENGDNL